MIDLWVARGLMQPVDAHHLFFVIWAATQTYADFDVQVATFLERRELQPEDFDTATALITRMVLGTCGLL